MNLILINSSKTKSMTKTMPTKSKIKMPNEKKTMSMLSNCTQKIEKRIHRRREMLERRTSQVWTQRCNCLISTTLHQWRSLSTTISLFLTVKSTKVRTRRILMLSCLRMTMSQSHRKRESQSKRGSKIKLTKKLGMSMSKKSMSMRRTMKSTRTNLKHGTTLSISNTMRT